jgi:uncharacterized protein YcbK (DUF882 family)
LQQRFDGTPARRGALAQNSHTRSIACGQATFRLLPALSLALFMAGCTVADDTADISPSASPAGPSTEIAASSEAAGVEAAGIDAVDPTVPAAEDVAAADTAAIETAAVAVETTAAEASLDGAGTTAEVTSANPVSEAGTTSEVAAAGATDTQQEMAASATAPVAAEAGSTPAPAPALAPALAVVAEAQPAARSPFARLFSRPSDQPQSSGVEDVDRSAAAPAPEPASAESADAEQAVALDDEAPAAEEPVITASIAAPAIEQPRAQLSVTVGDEAPLPGVRQVNSLYQIGHRDSFDPENYEDAGVIQVASAAGLAGLTGGRLAVQHEKVDVSCLKPKLVQTLRQIERRFGKPVVVTSGYRNRSYNRLVGGARESKHMSCEAADIQVPGVSKWDIAEYVRSLPGRGGVGTYCHTESVHVDIGSKRDWNWRCRRRG